MHEGTLYELSPSSSGGTESILHNFPSSRNDGASPQTGVLVGRTQSHLYGSTMTGGSDGSIYRLWFNNGHWVEKRMHDNGGEQTGGDLVMDRNLNITAQPITQARMRRARCRKCTIARTRRVSFACSIALAPAAAATERFPSPAALSTVLYTAQRDLEEPTTMVLFFP
jgi:hypothetical protein